MSIKDYNRRKAIEEEMSAVPYVTGLSKTIAFLRRNSKTQTASNIVESLQTRIEDIRLNAKVLEACSIYELVKQGESVWLCHGCLHYWIEKVPAEAKLSLKCPMCKSIHGNKTQR